MIPMPHTMASFAELTKDFLFTAAVFELNFKMLMMNEKANIRSIVTHAPRSVDVLLPNVVKLCENLMGKQWNEDSNDMIISERLSVGGNPVDNDEPCSHIRIKDHQSNIIYYVHEFHIRWMADPMISRMAKKIFYDFDFSPSKNTRLLANTAGFKVNVTMERKYHNFVINMRSLDEQVYMLDLRRGDKRYDVLFQTIMSIINFGKIIKITDTDMDAPIDYSNA